MFPYPSGAGLHVGHPEGYTATDIVARYKRMRGFDVLHPMGWDAFGLPAEQHAIKTGTHPAETTREEHRDLQAPAQDARLQLRLVARGRHDRSGLRPLDAVDLPPALPARARVPGEMPVNWCPALGTVLANEEVDRRQERARRPPRRSARRSASGCSGSPRTPIASPRTSRASTGPRGPLTAQRHWIGRTEGAEIVFAVDGHPDARIAVFTTRPDTLIGATYIVLAPEHPLVARAHDAGPARGRRRVRRGGRHARATSTAPRSPKTKTGVATGAFAIHPLTGAALPIWVADYVLGGYGTGAVMAVPAHDERDFAFAKAFGLPIVEVVSPDGALHERARGRVRRRRRRRAQRRVRRPADARVQARRRRRSSQTLGRGARARSRYKLRDWVFSRQRYWGEPIPIYFPVDVADPNGDPRQGRRAHDPLRPADRRSTSASCRCSCPSSTTTSPGDDPAGPLARAVDWRFFQKDGKWFARETNTMPQWAGSCWYYLRFLDPKNDAEAVVERGLRRLDARRPLRRRRRARRAPPALRALLAQGALRPRPREAPRAVHEARPPGDDPRRGQREDVASRAATSSTPTTS